MATDKEMINVGIASLRLRVGEKTGAIIPAATQAAEIVVRKSVITFF